MASGFKFYMSGVLKELLFSKILQRNTAFDIVDINGNAYVPKSPIDDEDLSASIPNSFWIQLIDGATAHLMYGNKLICKFNPVTGNLIYGFGDIATLPINKGGTNATTAAAARTNLGLAEGAVLDSGVTEGKIVKLLAGGKLPVLDASNLTNLPYLPAGMMAYFVGNTPPAGWLKANGSLLLRSTYAALFAYMGTTFGSGDGTTTFRLPDLRGKFIRSWSDGNTIDVGRVFGTDQGDGIPFNIYGPVTYGGGLRVDGYQDYADTYIYSPLTYAGNGSDVRPYNTALLACIKF